MFADYFVRRANGRIDNLVPRVFFWSAGECQKRLWRIRKKIAFLIGCSVTACIVLLQYPRVYPTVSPGDQPLVKEPGYEIGETIVQFGIHQDRWIKKTKDVFIQG